MEGLNFACEPSENQTSNINNQKLSSKDQRETARKAEKVIYDVYNQNNLQELDYETEVDTAILGDGCFKVTWDAQEKRIRVTSPDVTGLFAWWLGDDLSQVWWVASRYTLTREDVEQLYPSLRSRTGQRQTDKKTVTITELWTDRQFTLSLDNETIEDKPNPYGFIPFVIFPNVRQPKHFWGTSDIPPLKQAQRELNRALSQLSRILEVSGNPIAVLSKMRLMGRGGILIPPNCGQELFDVVQISDSGANQSAVTFRVVGLRFEYNVREARYQHKLFLGAP